MIPLDELLAQFPRSVPEFLDDSLRNLSSMISHPSECIEVSEGKVWYLYSHDENSCKYVLRQLQKLDYISVELSDTHDDPFFAKATIESNGWKRLHELQSKSSGNRDQAFIAMWFADEMKEFYDDGIFPAIEDSGLKCVRIDNQEHNNKICDEIIKEIRRSKFVVADFTGNRGGVYFEAGYALGLNIPVIWTVKKDYLEEEGVHFDTRQYNHIVYETGDELKVKLSNRIAATIT